jgi:NitT/TauT family transport system permease protein
MIIIIILYNIFIFNPVNDWARKFQYEDTEEEKTCSLGYTIFSNSKLFFMVHAPLKLGYKYFARLEYYKTPPKKITTKNRLFIDTFKDVLWYGIVLLIFIYSIYSLFNFIKTNVSIHEAIHAFYLGLITTIRIVCVMSIAIIFWLPVSIYIGSKPKLLKLAQPIVLILASFPANVIFPICVLFITKYHLNPNIWLSSLLLISMQWYLVFNIISGISTFPLNIKNVITMLKPTKITHLKKIIIPSILPNFMVGAITAWGSAWNSTIIAEYAEWGSTSLEAVGIGSYITAASNNGDTSRIILGILVMLFYIELFNRLMWRPLFTYTEKLEKLK